MTDRDAAKAALPDLASTVTEILLAASQAKDPEVMLPALATALLTKARADGLSQYEIHRLLAHFEIFAQRTLETLDRIREEQEPEPTAPGTPTMQ